MLLVELGFWNCVIFIEAVDINAGFTMTIKGVQVRISDGAQERPGLIVRGSSEDLCDIFWGDANPASNYMQGAGLPGECDAPRHDGDADLFGRVGEDYAACRSPILFAFDPTLTRKAKMDDSSGPAKSRRPQKNRQFAASHHVVERVGQRLAHGPQRYWCQEPRYQTGG